MSRARYILLLGAWAVLGCNNNQGNAVSYAFNRPERLEFACFGQYASRKADGTVTANPALAGRWEVLPRQCCTAFDPTNFAVKGIDWPQETPYPSEVVRGLCYGSDAQPLRTPTLHAVVTQSTRGEVAAVDLTANRVLDSDRQVPGFTFLDTGGLPTGIVVPKHLPNGTDQQAPKFFYVASAEQEEVRAIPLCRFRAGSRCGPDLEGPNLDTGAYEARLRIPLPGAPEDMILGPDQALYVSMPTVQGADGATGGLIARIELAPAGDAADAFALEGGRPRQPMFFSVPAMTDGPMPEPVIDPIEYQTSCGLGVAYAASSFVLPNAPRAAARPSAEPARLRFDEESGLLLVSDRASPGVHVFAPAEEGRLVALGALRTGQPLKEFVLTPRVPTTAVSGQQLLALTTDPEILAAETKRYLYGIDVDGRVAVFAFAAEEEGELPTLTPLLAPEPDLQVARYADRIELPLPAQTLEVIDTRTQSSYVCGQDSVDALRAERERLRGLKVRSEAEQRLLARVEARIATFDNAASNYLRGVFVAVASTAGRLTLLDVHDLDPSCRAQKECCAPGGAKGANGVPENCTAENAGDAALYPPRNPDSQDSLLVRRHTWRRGVVGQQKVNVATQSVLAAQACTAPVDVPLENGPVCTSADSYVQRNETWSIQYQGTLPGSPMGYAHWERGDPASTQTTLVAPTAMDLCARGVEPGDLVAVVGRAPEQQRGTGCPDPSADTAPLFEILEARPDRLLVQGYTPDLLGDDPMIVTARDARQREMADTAARCYPDFVGVELRARGYLVLASSGSYLHRIVTGPDGTCIADPALDPRLDSRVRERAPGQLVFWNPYLKLELAQQAADAAPQTRETTITVSGASTGFAVDAVTAGDPVSDALPSTLQYLPEVGDLFLLDIAGQGLRRYGLLPFRRDDTVFR